MNKSIAVVVGAVCLSGIVIPAEASSHIWTTQAQCAKGWSVTGGGYYFSKKHRGVRVINSKKFRNGWQITIKERRKHHKYKIVVWARCIKPVVFTNEPR